MAGSAREEAERLVATILARAAASGLGAAASGRDSAKTSSGTTEADVLGFLGESVAGVAGLLSSGSWSTGSAECCVCPVCKAIAAMRDTSPETAERLASSAGDIATGVAGLMRALSSLGGERPRPPAPRASSRPADPDGVWARATGESPESGPGPESGPDPADDPWAAATAESAREAAAAAKARALAAEQAVARAVEQARAAAEARRAATSGKAGAATSGEAGAEASPAAGTATEAGTTEPSVTRTRIGFDVWAMATAEAAAGDAAAHRSVDHELGASAPEDRDAAPGDGARAGDAV
jgi:hypothetical protein